jgi:aryl-alcohol dehydrogenase-like predicted oxidoreductase
MALAWTLTRPFLGATIIGATSVAQVELALGAAEVSLTEAVMAEISAAWKANPDPY